MSLKNFEVYQLSIEFLGLANEIAENLPRGYSELKDQLKRASLSVILNVAEGAGHYTSAQQNRHYTIARGSAFECYAAVDAISTLGLSNSDITRQSINIIERIIAMLTKLCLK